MLPLAPIIRILSLNKTFINKKQLLQILQDRLMFQPHKILSYEFWILKKN